MMKIGITGQNGFVGTHLANSVKLLKDEFELVEWNREAFGHSAMLDDFVSKCDVIVHLAAVNRHESQEVLHDSNINLVQTLVASCTRTNSKPHILFSSSTQESRSNLYGNSKMKGRLILEEWANNNGTIATGLVIPNVFGPFCKPFYNSVVATFCHQVANNENPQIKIDAELSLIYVGELVDEFINCIREKKSGKIDVSATSKNKVSEILNLLKGYHSTYQEEGRIPSIENTFEHNLFNTYRCSMPKADYFPKHFVKHTDNRGHFVELGRIGIPGQVSFSTTKPGITRGNHFHTRKIERFAVIKGKAKIQLRRIGTNDTMDFLLDGEDPSYVDMPIWYTHNITNIGEDELITVFWINEAYNAANPDTYFETV